MIRGLYSSVSAMLQLQAKQSLTTNNIANANTTGYKSEVMVEKPFPEYMISNRDNYVKGQAKKQEIGTLSFGVKMDDTITSHYQGDLIETGSETSFAILGDGFFTVMDREGNTAYTRDGVFKVSDEGYLMTSAGHLVQGINTRTGALEPINVGIETDIVVDSDNNIKIDDIISYRFNIVEPNNYDNFKIESDNLFYGGDGVKAVNGNNYIIKQKYKEGSNVDIVAETTNLMTTLRAFEANQTVVKALDSTMNLVANELGKI